MPGIAAAAEALGSGSNHNGLSGKLQITMQRSSRGVDVQLVFRSMIGRRFAHHVHSRLPSRVVIRSMV